MVWDYKSSRMKEPNVDKKEQVMGFHTNTIVVINLSKGAYKQILGQVMDLNYFPWIFNLCLTKQRHFAYCSLPIQLQSSCFYYYTHIYNTYVGVKGASLAIMGLFKMQ